MALLVCREGFCWHEHAEDESSVVVVDQYDHVQAPGEGSDSSSHCLIHCSHDQPVMLTECAITFVGSCLHSLSFFVTNDGVPDYLASSIDYPPRLVI